MAAQHIQSDSQQLDLTHPFPPDLTQLLIEAIPRLFKYKVDLLSFFDGAGVNRSFTADLKRQRRDDPESISKFAIARTVLNRLNEDGDRSLAPRRELLKRVVEYEDFSACWPNDQLPAKGYVAQIGKLVGAKDAFTKMNQARESEVRERQKASRAQLQEVQLHQREIDELKRDLSGLFGIPNPQQRGLKIEGVLNRFFDLNGVLVRESFTRTSESGSGAVEQVDGAIEVDSHIYLVEMKWHSQPIGVEDVSRHIVRVASRGDCRGMFLSESRYTAPAIETCREALKDMVFVLCTLEEIVMLLDRGGSFEEFLKRKVRGATLDKSPLTVIRE